MPIFRRDLPPAPRPNILVLTSDDMNCDSVGVYGGKFKEPTPHLDRLADQSRDGRSFAPFLRGETQEGRDSLVAEYNENSGGSRHPLRTILTRDDGFQMVRV